MTLIKEIILALSLISIPALYMVSAYNGY